MTDFEDVRVLTLQKKSDGQKAMKPGARCWRRTGDILSLIGTSFFF